MSLQVTFSARYTCTRCSSRESISIEISMYRRPSGRYFIAGCKPCIGCTGSKSCSPKEFFSLSSLELLQKGQMLVRSVILVERIHELRMKRKIISEQSRKENVVSSRTAAGRIYRLLGAPFLEHSWLARSRTNCWRNARRPSENARPGGSRR